MEQKYQQHSSLPACCSQDFCLHQNTILGTSNSIFLLFTWSSMAGVITTCKQLAEWPYSSPPTPGNSSLCTGSLPTSGCFQCQQPRSCLIPGYLKGTLFCPAPALHHHGDFVRDTLIPQIKTAVLVVFQETSNAMVRPVP